MRYINIDIIHINHHPTFTVEKSGYVHRIVLFLSESHFKDNPALSMLNDSDDDVIYG